MTLKAQYNFKVFRKSTLDRTVAADRQQRVTVCEECHNVYCTRYICFVWGNSPNWERVLEMENCTAFWLGDWRGRENCRDLIINRDNIKMDLNTA